MWSSLCNCKAISPFAKKLEAYIGCDGIADPWKIVVHDFLVVAVARVCCWCYCAGNATSTNSLELILLPGVVIPSFFFLTGCKRRSMESKQQRRLQKVSLVGLREHRVPVCLHMPTCNPPHKCLCLAFVQLTPHLPEGSFHSLILPLDHTHTRIDYAGNNLGSKDLSCHFFPSHLCIGYLLGVAKRRERERNVAQRGKNVLTGFPRSIDLCKSSTDHCGEFFFYVF